MITRILLLRVFHSSCIVERNVEALLKHCILYIIFRLLSNSNVALVAQTDCSQSPSIIDKYHALTINQPILFQEHTSQPPRKTHASTS